MDNKNIVYREDTNFIDNNTGEVTSTSTRKLSKVPRTPDFIMMYTKHIAFLEHLNKSETTILFELLSKYIGLENIIFLSSAVKKKIVKKLEVDNSYINRALRGLKAKKVIVDNKDGLFCLNPIFFGKGNWEDVHKLRHEIAYDFDFEKLEFEETRKVKASYDSEFNMSNHDIVETKEYTDEKGVATQEIIVEEKEDKSDIELLKEQNRNKELLIEEMTLKLQMKKEGLL